MKHKNFRGVLYVVKGMLAEINYKCLQGNYLRRNCCAAKVHSANHHSKNI